MWERRTELGLTKNLIFLFFSIFFFEKNLNYQIVYQKGNHSNISALNLIERNNLFIK